MIITWQAKKNCPQLKATGSIPLLHNTNICIIEFPAKFHKFCLLFLMHGTYLLTSYTRDHVLKIWISFMKKMRCTNEHMSRLIRLWTTWNFPRSTFLGWQCALPIRQVLWEVEVVFVIISNMYKYQCKCKNKHYTGCGREGGAHQGRVPMEGRDWTVESQFLGSRGPLRVPLAPSRPFPQQKFLLLQCHLYLPPWATQPLPLIDVDMDMVDMNNWTCLPLSTWGPF